MPQIIPTVCVICNQPKTPEELVQRPNHDGTTYYWNRCKACYDPIRKSRENVRNTKDEMTLGGLPEERALIKSLSQRGIFVTNGRSSQFSNVDLVAWGCVPIELKTAAMMKTGHYIFKFSPKQCKHGLHDGLVALRFAGDISYFVFRSDNLMFYEHGELRHSISFVGNPPTRFNVDPLEMIEARDNWQLIETKRLEIINRLSFE